MTIADLTDKAVGILNKLDILPAPSAIEAILASCTMIDRGTRRTWKGKAHYAPEKIWTGWKIRPATEYLSRFADPTPHQDRLADLCQVQPYRVLEATDAWACGGLPPELVDLLMLENDGKPKIEHIKGGKVSIFPLYE
jgi:hypothetical protein